MVKLKDIKRIDNIIMCKAFVEDCDIPIQLFLNEDNAELSNYDLPNGYEWCVSHILHARKYLRSLIGQPITETQRNIMWY